MTNIIFVTCNSIKKFGRGDAGYVYIPNAKIGRKGNS